MNYDVQPMKPRPRGVLPLILGAAALVLAGLWWLTSRPSERELVTRRTVCAMNGSFECSLPEAVVAGPIVLAAVGALLVVVGAILYAGQQNRTREG